MPSNIPNSKEMDRYIKKMPETGLKPNKDLNFLIDPVFLAIIMAATNKPVNEIVNGKNLL